MDLELKVKKIQIKVGEDVYSVRAMNVRDQIEHQKKIKACENDTEKQLLVLIELFKGLGVPDHVIDMMDADFALKLLNVLSGNEKKSE